MSKTQLEINCHCQCGKTSVSLLDTPIARMICHCTICQEFNQADYGDVTLFFSKDVQLHDKSQVEFKTYKAPPAVQRGKCSHCHQPSIELFNLPVTPALTLIPSALIPTGPAAIPISAHIFYHSRVQDIHDQAPKISGYLKSQLAVTKEVFKGACHKMFTL
ncbi:MAG: GFA family protein [Oleiphilus sp.]